MRRYQHIFAALTAAGVLSACGGGGGGSQVIGGLVGGDSANLGSTRAAIGRINEPNFGSVTQSTNGDGTGTTNDSTRAEFDGQDTTITITRDDASTLTLDTSENIHQFDIDISDVRAGYSFRGDALLSENDDDITLGLVYTHWNDSDATEFIAGGYWVRIPDGSPTNYELGAFVDGPEIRSSGSALTASSTATYDGVAAGFYAYSGSSVPDVPDQFGEYNAPLRLMANFDDYEIDGCMGCGEGFRFFAITADGQETIQTEAPLEVTLGTAGFSASDRTFSSTDFTVTIHDERFNVLTDSGSWGGRFSSTDESSRPRLAAGTAGGSWSDSTGGRGALTGIWLAAP